MEIDFSFDETDEFGNEDFGNEDFGIESEYFENEEYINEKPVITVKNEKPVITVKNEKPVITVKNEKPIINLKSEKPIINLKSEKPIINLKSEKPIINLKSEKPVINLKKTHTVSYDDILKTMNVNLVNGKLVLSKGTSNKVEVEEVKEEKTSKKVNFANQEPIPQEVKNSAIYNKYFKTYNSIQPTIEVRRPKTIEEYKQMLLEDKIKRIQANRRIAMIKPKKLFFSRENTSVINMSQPTNLNKVFNFPR
jgi:hypothetical protein